MLAVGQAAADGGHRRLGLREGRVSFTIFDAFHILSLDIWARWRKCVKLLRIARLFIEKLKREVFFRNFEIIDLFIYIFILLSAARCCRRARTARTRRRRSAPSETTRPRRRPC